MIKYGPHGRVLGTARDSPSAATPSRIYEKIGVACPKCGKDIVLKKTTEGQKILWLYRQPGVRFHGMAEAFRMKSARSAAP